MPSSTRCAVAASTREGLLMVRDTVEVDTRARRATSWMVAGADAIRGGLTGLKLFIPPLDPHGYKGLIENFSRKILRNPLTWFVDLA